MPSPKDIRIAQALERYEHLLHESAVAWYDMTTLGDVTNAIVEFNRCLNYYLRIVELSQSINFGSLAWANAFNFLERKIDIPNGGNQNVRN